MVDECAKLEGFVRWALGCAKKKTQVRDGRGRYRSIFYGFVRVPFPF